MAEGKKSRKLGRNSGRPSQKRYVSELRAQKNKRIKIQKAAERVKKDAERVSEMKVKRGSARARARGDAEFFMPAVM